MHPKMVGNPLIAWRDDTTLQVGWGSHCVVVEDAPAGLPEWLRLLNGSRDEAELLDAAVAGGIPEPEARGLLSELADAHLITARAPLTVRLHPCGLLTDPLTRALRDVGVNVARDADVVVYAQGQLPTLVASPPAARRLVPLWFAAHAVHVGPVLDRDLGPCPMCIDATWAEADPSWPGLVAQAGTVATWSHPAHVVHAAAVIAMIADAPSTVGLEMIMDTTQPGPRWRVWSVNTQCPCQNSEAAS